MPPYLSYAASKIVGSTRREISIWTVVGPTLDNDVRWNLRGRSGDAPYEACRGRSAVKVVSAFPRSIL